MATQFIPRSTFPPLLNLPRSYFLGHHAKALSNQKQLMPRTDLIIELRDYRVPLSSINPLLEENLTGKERMIIYMKQDLGTDHSKADRARDDLLREFHHPVRVNFVDWNDSSRRRSSTRKVLAALKDFAKQRDALTPMMAMIVGMPNVGKSTLLNALRKAGTNKANKVARTGNQPGVTRNISTIVKLIEGETESESVYTRDTPGVFVPTVDDPEVMLKLALCGCVGQGIIQPVILADYLLYRLNLVDPSIYRPEHPPTNDILALLHRLARKLGKLNAGGELDLAAAANWFLNRWRAGGRGRFILDDVTEESLQLKAEQDRTGHVSFSQAKKIYKSDMLQQKAASVL